MQPGDRIGHIQIAKLLGRGGMGDVYAGFDEKLQRDVAIKILREGRWKRAARARLLREARALSRLDHPHICAIYDLIETPEGDALVLERIVGKNLRKAVRAGLDRASRLRIAEELAEVLVVAHAHGIVHRDLKPTNVLLTPGGSVKVLDFGLAYSPEDADATPLRATRREGEPASLLLSATPEGVESEEPLETAVLETAAEDSSDRNSISPRCCARPAGRPKPRRSWQPFRRRPLLRVPPRRPHPPKPSLRRLFR